MKENNRQIMNGKNITLGTCYYPEHWDKSLWEPDLDRMLAAGIQVVRIAEFAWNKFEPTEGNYDFRFFDEFLNLAEKKGMKVIFCTPTATPPAWLTCKYPEVLNADKEGHRYQHGNRRHYNYNSAVYQNFTAKLVEQLGAHYGKHPAIIGWQLDNELNCETNEFYSESDTEAFRTFVQEKYQTLDKLNEAWGTVFWNQTYTDWKEVDVPRKVYSNSNNPHRELDYIRFVSDSACRFAKLQADILRKFIKENDFITTNGLFGSLDYQRLREESLTFITFDSYPDFAYSLDGYQKDDPFKDRWSSKKLAETRAISSVYGIMEQQSGANGWTGRMEAPSPKPGQITLWTMQSIANGADYVSYFRWRTSTMGTEIYWHGILDYSGRDNRRLKEITRIHENTEKLQDIAGAEYAAKIGILKDYDNEWDTYYDKWHARVESASQDALFMGLQQIHAPFNYVYLTEKVTAEDLQCYELLFYPHPVILTKERMEVLEAYVANGGRLVMACRTGYKSEDGRCVMDKLPGLASKVTGTDIPEYSFVSPEDGHVYADWDGEKIEAAVFNDLLAPTGEGQVLARYQDTYYAGEAALIRNSFGKGEAYYFGGAFTPETVKVFAEKLGVAEPWREYITLPESCELAVRKKGDRYFMFVLNYPAEEAEIIFHKPVRDMLDGTYREGRVVLSAYEARVFEF